jgi:hypothetical protein
MFFVGVQSLEGSRLFVEVLRTGPPDHTIIQRLSSGLLGRTLSQLRPRAQFLVGTADVPASVFVDYMSYLHQFRELGSWELVETNGNSELAGLTPASSSASRSQLLLSRQLSDNVPLYVIYIYHAVSEPLSTLALAVAHIPLRMYRP